MNKSFDDGKWHPPVWLITYGGYFVLALVATTILYCIFEVFRIKYGTIIITKKTLDPYFISLLYLFMLLLETIFRCYALKPIIENKPPNPDKKPSDRLNWPGDRTAVTYDILYNFKTLFFEYFMITRITSVTSLLVFMTYQSHFKISELDIAKQGFQRFERKLYKLSRVWFWINFVSMSVMLIVNDGILNGHASQHVSIAYTHIQLVTFIILFKVYFDVSSLFMVYMYRKHRLAYKTHGRKKMLLIVSTTLSIIVICCKQLGFAFWRSCMLTHRAECESIGTCNTENDDVKPEFCRAVNVWMNNVDWGQTSDIYFVIETIVVYLLPIWGYMVLEQPHDCFRCLGKDPDRKFSQFQMNHTELIVRKMKSKFGDDKRISQIIRHQSIVGMNPRNLELKMSYSRAKTGNASSKKLYKSDSEGFRYSLDSGNYRAIDIYNSEDSEMVYRAAGTFVGHSEQDHSEHEFHGHTIQEDSLESEDSEPND